jgi:hypothetical protein
LLPLSLRFQTAAAASRLLPHDVRGPWVSEISCVAPRAKKPLGSPTQFAGEAGTGKDHRELRSPEVALPDTRCPSQAARKPQQTPPGASSIEIDVSQEDFAAMTNLARTTAETVLRTLEASIGSLFSRVALGTTIQEGKSACCTWQRSAWIVQFMR